MDTLKYKNYSEDSPINELNNVKECYPNIFTYFQKIKSELQYIYVDEEYVKC